MKMTVSDHIAANQFYGIAGEMGDAAGRAAAATDPRRATINGTIAIVYGAIGGVLFELVALYSRLTAWQSQRRRARSAGQRQTPSIVAFVDPVADSAVTLTRLALGAAAGWVLSSATGRIYRRLGVACRLRPP